MHLLQILRTVGPDIWDSKIKLVRHKDTTWDLDLLRRKDGFHIYEGHQAREVFARAEYLLCFLGEGQSRSRFIGCRRILGVREGSRSPPPGFPYPEMPLGPYWYELEEVPGFEDLIDRLVIDWGSGTRSWVQWLREDRPREVIEVLPRGHAGEFPGYDDVILPYADLRRIVRHPDANRSWHMALSQVAGVYLITDLRSGELYVGSASGRGGILSRWADYVRTGRGGNKLLRSIVATDPDRMEDWQFTILRPLPLSMSQKEVVAVESASKRKLGSRAHGLNAN